ncbi:MAG: TspO/MBR family protein [Rhizobiaceae bacterium]
MSVLRLFLFLLLVVGGGSLIGVTVQPGTWYAGLQKPPFNPPNWIFAPVWTTLYVMIAVAGWRSWERGGAQMRLWWGQLVLNFAWTPVFFGAHLLGPALAVIAALLAAILAFMAAARRRRDGVSALLFAPYAAWVAFATLLNASIWWLNAGS